MDFDWLLKSNKTFLKPLGTKLKLKQRKFQQITMLKTCALVYN